MWLEATKSGGGESDDGHFIFDTGFLVHSLSFGVGEAQYELLSAVGNGGTAGLSRFIFGRVVQGDGPRQRDAIDKVVALERALGVVLDGDDLGVLLVRTCILFLAFSTLEKSVCRT